jgi:hypothetical protein
MNPRAVQMAKAVVDSGLVDVELLGNVIAPFMRGWTNNSANYYTNSVSPAYWNPGSPFMGQPTVYTYDFSGGALYRWFPIRPQVFGFFSSSLPDAITPSSFSASPFPPPIGNLTPYFP